MYFDTFQLCVAGSLCTPHGPAVQADQVIFYSERERGKEQGKRGVEGWVDEFWMMCPFVVVVIVVFCSHNWKSNAFLYVQINV